MSDYSLDFQSILSRYLTENCFGEGKRTDGKELTGAVTREDTLQPVFYVVLAVPFWSLIIWGIIILVLELLLKISFSDQWIFMEGIPFYGVMYFIIYVIVCHFTLKYLYKSAAQRSARIYFEEGVHAGLRQLYLAKENLEEDKFEEVVEHRMRHEWRVDLVQKKVEDECNGKK